MENERLRLRNEKFEERINGLYGLSLEEAKKKDPYLAEIAFDTTEKEPNRLGWTMPNLQWLFDQPETVNNVIRDAAQIREKYRYVIFCGMGGSGLSIQVVKTIFDERETRIYSLRTTDPEVIEDILDEIAGKEGGSIEKALANTLIIPISKSGTTQETVSHKEYFEKLLKRYGIDNKQHTWVVTDKGSPFDSGDFVQREIQLNGKGDIGGRFAAPTTNIFLLPLAIVAPEQVWPVLEKAKAMNMSLEEAGEDVFLDFGSFIFHNAANLGKNKLTIFTPNALRGLSLWFEQLLEESSGKKGKGVSLFYGENLEAQDLKPVKDNDRIFLRVNIKGEKPKQGFWDYLISKGYPVFEITVEGIVDIGGIMLGLQRSVAALAYLWNINFVNQPSVKGYKEQQRIAEAEIKAGKLQMPDAVNSAAFSNLTLYYDPLVKAGILTRQDIEKEVKNFGSDIKDAAAVYAAVLNILKNRPGFTAKEIISYGRMTEGLKSAFSKARETIFTKMLKMPSKLGEGPDKNHSYHQLIEDGPDMWLSLYFMPLRTRPSKYGVDYSGDLLKAQTLGTVRSLIKKGRKVLLLTAKGTREDAEPDLKRFFEKTVTYLRT